MNHAGSAATIDVDALRVGMHIHLDVGWMSHPFPLSSFRLASQEQIDIVRALGVRTVRWSPEHSALAAAEARAEEADARGREGADEDAASCAPRVPGCAALAVCERQFAEATRECRRLFDRIDDDPVAARDTACALTRALSDKMAADPDLCIRLLTEAAGDRASAHAVNVALLSLLMGRSLDLSETDLLDLGVGALLHDIGKRELPPRVRHRDDAFTAAETRLYEEHVACGVARASTMALRPASALVIAQHHERADGSGFPLRLGRERLAAASCIVALADRYDNLCNPPLPARALTAHEAMSLLYAQSRDHFDGAILGAFVKLMGVYPPGSVVELADDRYALVVSVHPGCPLRPRVALLDPGEAGETGPLLDLNETPALAIRRSLRASSLPAWLQERLPLRSRVAWFFEPAAPDVLA